MTEPLNRFERTAASIAARYGVHVEYAPANREYVVEGCPASTARRLERMP